MDLKKLHEALKNEPSFRVRQALQAVFTGLIDNWDRASNLPLALRERLNEVCPLELKADYRVSAGGRTVKAAVSFGQDRIETVLMRHAGGRNTVCVSSQAGCPIGCGFCLTGSMGFRRNLKAGEILDQVLCFSRWLKKEGSGRISNIVFMGMGEPFLNYAEVMKAIRSINDKSYFGIGARRISVSTVGILDGIRRLAKEPLPVNLAVSLHAPDDALRRRLIPYKGLAPIAELLTTVRKYIETTGRRVMIEYLPLAGVNDSPAQARELAAVLEKYLGRLYFVNLISYNVAGVTYRASKQKAKNEFKRELARARVDMVERYRFGRDIEAACGQLVG